MMNLKTLAVALVGTVVIGALVLFVLEAPAPHAPPGVSTPEEVAVAPPATSPVAAAPMPGIENLYEVAPGLLCGGQPDGDAAFAALRDRGVKVVISVDGAFPDQALAEQNGLRYIHLPIGYDGIPDQSRANLKAAVESAHGAPVFLHCHHGKHRGPAAAAYAGVATGAISTDAGLQLLTLAGTKPEYVGLWDAIRKYQAPTVPAGELVARAAVEPTVAAMARLDQHWEAIRGAQIVKLKEDQLATAQELAKPSELIPTAALLHEEFRELARAGTGPDAEYKKLMRSATTASQLLVESLKKDDRPQAHHAARQLSQTCIDCHASYRN